MAQGASAYSRAPSPLPGHRALGTPSRWKASSRTGGDARFPKHAEASLGGIILQHSVEPAPGGQMQTLPSDPGTKPLTPGWSGGVWGSESALLIASAPFRKQSLRAHGEDHTGNSWL